MNIKEIASKITESLTASDKLLINLSNSADYQELFKAFKKKRTKTLWKLLDSGKLSKAGDDAAKYALELRGEIANIMKQGST